jgi:hypothetical protein
MKKHTVLFLEWTTHGREFEIDLPLMYFFENYLGWNVEYKSQFNLPSVIKNTPDIIIKSGSTGAKLGLEWLKIIRKSKILVFTHVTEGMFREEDIDEFVWGWNKEKKLLETLCTLWSYKAYSMSVKHYPELQSKYRVSGSVGHDKYHFMINDKISKNKYTKVVGYAAFDFNNILNNEEYFVKEFGRGKFIRLMNLAKKANEILKYIIHNNNDILFLLKAHPGDGDKEPLEFDGLLNQDNVLVVDKKSSIVDVIASSDVWLNINSSTNLEAWLLSKPTISFVIDKDGFSSDVMHGTVLENNPHKINAMIQEYYSYGTIERFIEKQDRRKKLIKEYIGYDDGMNHVRYMSFLKPFVERVEKGVAKKGKWDISKKRLFEGYAKHILYTLANGKNSNLILEKWSTLYQRFDLNSLEFNKNLYYPRIERFYIDNKEQIDKLYINHAEDFSKLMQQHKIE